MCSVIELNLLRCVDKICCVVLRCVAICDSDIVSFIMWYDIWLWHVMICYVLRCMMITSRILLCIVTCALSVSLCVCVSILLHIYMVSVYCLSIHSPPVSLFFCYISVLLPHILSLPPSTNITLNYFTQQLGTVGCERIHRISIRHESHAG